MKFIKEREDFVHVPALFLKDYICDAPPEYVKVYLFGLYLAQGEADIDICDLEDKLHLSKDRINSALSYWQKKGFARTDESGVRFVVPSEENQTPNDGAPEEKQSSNKSAPQEEHTQYPPELYDKAEFNGILNKLLKRELTHSQLQKIYDFTDVFGLPEDVVIMMVQHCVTVKGHEVGIAYLNEVAKTWAEKGIKSLKEAQIQIEEYNALAGGAKKIMTKMGLLGKLPGAAESEYYDKWTKEWGFMPDAILYAMKNTEFSSINQPFKYLDGILKNLKDKGAIKASQIYNLAEKNEKERDEVKEIAAALSSGGKTADFAECREYYKKWRNSGIPKEIILSACAQSKKFGAAKPEAVSRKLKEWQNAGLKTTEDVNAYLSRRSSFEKLITDVYQKAGITKQIGEQDIRLCETLINKYQITKETLFFAAEISAERAAEPYTYFKKILQIWAQNGIKTLEEAKKRDESFKAAGKKAKTNKPGFEQREFDEKAEKQRRVMEMFKEEERINALKANS